MQRIMPLVFKDGFGSWTARYGLPISHLDVRFVNGYPYMKTVIAGVPDRSGPPPPERMLKVLVRLSPPLRRRAAAAKRAMAEQPWREERRRWIEQGAPAQTSANLAIQDEDPATLTDTELAQHLRRAHDNALASSTDHFGMIGAFSLPLGLLLVAAEEWGIPNDDIIDLMAGSS